MSSRTNLRLAVAWYSYGGLEGACVDSMMQELQLAAAAKIDVRYSRIGDDALISRSRSKAMSDFLATDASVFVQIDHDLSWAPGDLLHLAQVALEKDAIVGGLYSMRGKKQGFAGRPLIARPEDGVNINLGTDSFIEAEYVAGGFTAIPRSVVEEVLKAGLAAAEELSMGAPSNRGRDPEGEELTECVYTDGSRFHDYYRPIVVPSRLFPGSAEYLSEDWSFSWRATQANPRRKQWFWAKPILQHWGKYGYNMVEAQAPASRVVRP